MLLNIGECFHRREGVFTACIDDVEVLGCVGGARVAEGMLGGREAAATVAMTQPHDNLQRTLSLAICR